MIDMTSGHVAEEATNGVNKLNLYTLSSWDYFCNNAMQEIIPGVYLGPYSSAQFHCLGTLREKGIRYIICVRQATEAHFIKPQINDPNFTYLTLDIANHETENILRFFPKVNDFIDEALSKNFKVLVHGNSGNSRSASLVLAYIMEKFGLALSEALCFVKTKRASVNLNEGFKAQLSEYEPIYRARQNLTFNGSSSNIRTRPKRKIEQLTETVEGYGEYELIPPPPSPIPWEVDSPDDANSFGPQNATDFSQLYKLWLAKR
ncbi:serine/threonine/tyrosine-interacting protein-like [Anthonomus grandis grandis]|uniref:serine/threonine/tyrosine-interacting protein-like n=1 Tax=Anthonomus grandis grandis TaxID=2921223 RepID=UPI002166960A|nr:serine/threonine/tyrosine-interacting protein-like [Anthonomus grandis grandis]